jgi:hypothetical protein
MTTRWREVPSLLPDQETVTQESGLALFIKVFKNARGREQLGTSGFATRRS